MSAEKCFRCLGVHASNRCDDRVLANSSLPYPQMLGERSPKPEAPTRTDEIHKAIEDEEYKSPLHFEETEMNREYHQQYEPLPAQAVREWWIETHEIVKGRKNISGKQVWPQSYETDVGEKEKQCIHVIEYAAYEALERELAALKVKLAESERFNANHKEIAARLNKELSAAEAENARLRGALERVSKIRTLPLTDIHDTDNDLADQYSSVIDTLVYIAKDALGPRVETFTCEFPGEENSLRVPHKKSGEP